MLPIWLLAAMMLMMCYWRFSEPWANAMLAILLPKLWFGLKIMTGTTVLGCLPGAHSPLLDSKKLQNQLFFKIGWIRKKSWSMLSIWLLAAMMIMMYYWRFWEPCAGAMLVVLLPKLWFGLKIMTGTTVFGCLPGAHTLTGPKKASKRTILHNRLNKKKLLVDVANLPTCCHDDYDVLLEVFGTLGKCYVSDPVAKTLVWIENHDWHNCFWMSSWGSPLLDI